MRFPLRHSLPLLILTVALLSAARADEATHAALLGKPAPDIQAEYAVNSKLTRLAELREVAKGKEKQRGKIVLIVFGHLSKGATWNGLGEAQHWYDKHKIDGLAVVMVPT